MQITTVESNRSRALVSKAVLVVEDDPLIAASVAQYLRESGWIVIGVPSAHEAMDFLDRDVQIDIAFVDFKLPGGPTGAMLAQWSEARAPHLPVLLTSGLSSFHSGFTRGKHRRFIAKPYVLSEVDELLNAMLNP